MKISSGFTTNGVRKPKAHFLHDSSRSIWKCLFAQYAHAVYPRMRPDMPSVVPGEIDWKEIARLFQKAKPENIGLTALAMTGAFMTAAIRSK